MKISNQQLFDNSVTQINQLHSTVADLQAKIGQGTQLLRPSDDATQTALIQRLESARNRQDVYLSTLDVASTRLDLEETAITTAADMLMRMKELALMASDGSVTDTDVSAIRLEAQELRDSLLSIVNEQDLNGNYVFSGSNVTSPAFTETAGVVTYTGNDQTITVAISENRRIELNRPGNEIFSSVDRGGVDADFFTVLDDFITALDNSDAVGIDTGLTEVSELYDNMSVSLVDIGSRQKTVLDHRDTINETKLRYDLMLTSEKELDYTAAITDLTAEMLALESAQASFAKISQLSLFDYIR